jgi:hypothetical protein
MSEEYPPAGRSLPRLRRRKIEWYASLDDGQVKAENARTRVVLDSGQVILEITAETKRGTGAELIIVRLPVGDVLAAIGKAINAATGDGFRVERSVA